MATVSSILDKALEYLHDDGTIWTRTELLDYLNEGYRQLLVRTRAARNLVALDVPPRPQYAITYPWERQFVDGTIHEWTWADNLNGTRACYAWEVEQELGMTPTTSEGTYTYPWERITSSGNVREEAERYPYPDDHLQTFRIAFDSQRVPPLSIRELDTASPRWESEDGGPTWYHGGLGRQKEFALYPMATDYVQGIAIQAEGLGTIESFSGSRSYTVTENDQILEGYAFTTTGDISSEALTGPGRKITLDTTVAADYQVMFTWEKQHAEGTALTAHTGYVVTYGWEAAFVGQAYTYLAGLGAPHSLAGGRQYLPTAQANLGESPLGTVGEWKSSEDALLLDYALTAPTLAEADTPALLPTAFDKYLRFYTLGRAFGREGEGRNPILTDHYMQRFQMGEVLLKRLANFAQWAALHQLGAAEAVPSRPGRPRLPAEYPRIR